MPVEIFCCYARKDQHYLEELKKHLNLLERRGLINLWHDRKILPGINWKSEIDKHLNTSNIILLLVSPDFMASDYCYGVELQRAIERHRIGEARIIPVIIRPIDWEETPLGEFQALPTNRKPIAEWLSRDRAFREVARGINEVVMTFLSNEGLFPKRTRILEDIDGEPIDKDLDSGPLRITLASNQSQKQMKQRPEETRTSPLAHEQEKTPVINSGNPKAVLNLLPPIFLFNVDRLPSADELFGRTRECSILLKRTRQGASTSIVGPRRIGKTWLIDYLTLVAPTELGTRFRIARLSTRMPNCKTVTDFTIKALEALNYPHITHLPNNIDLETLKNFVEELNTKNIIPVLCIDEFEGFFNHQAFDCLFFANLRYIAQNGLVLIITSKDPLVKLVAARCKTSTFFNIFDQITLKSFTANEAEQFLEKKKRQAGFTDDEYDRLLKYGEKKQQQWPPSLLQLVGAMLLEDKTLAEAERPDYYRPNDLNYWEDFEKRLEERYQG